MGKIGQTVFVKKNTIITFLTKGKKAGRERILKNGLARGITSCYGFVFNISPETQNKTDRKKHVFTNRPKHLEIRLHL